MAAVRIAGIDPGFDRLGVCILEKDGGKETLLYSDCITTNKKDVFGKRLQVLGSALADIFKQFKPDELAIEKLFFTNNQTTAIQVAEVRGVILYIAELNRLSVFEYSPPQVKVAVAGHGKATKADIGLMVPRILKVPNKKNMLDDELDAIAIALTHSAHRKTLSWQQ